ncbi:hypothetical protein GGF43_000464 [Coemansia sp. RSA 2618]|nr:hypothetical protein GGF43_000464 [Coemansia sp. RSA 2618]
MEDHINVAIRVRPLNQREQRSSTAPAAAALPWHIQRDTITQRAHADGRPANGNSFTFDKVFDQKDTTRQVYDDIVKNIITSSMGGFNGTIFAYGQTSSGKTHTMHGSGSELGIIKLAVKEIFDTVKNDEKREYLIRVSFLEIYNEVLRDLLEPTKTNLKIHENAKREIFVGDLSEHIVFNADHVEELLQKGDRNRHVAGTNMNERSSRSHTLFRIVIESREKAESDSTGSDGENGLAKRQQRLSTGSFVDSEEFTGAVMVSCLNLVDLAGSERVGQTGAEGQRLKEGAHINKSLLALGTVIARLSEDGDRGHIPYRDSRLTRILQPSLGGNAKTLIVCTITPSPDYIDEALSTLKFASRAKTIRNTPEVNQELRGDALLRRLKRASELEKEIAQMKEIERKKNKIEADNEALLRQLWKSQKERERLQRELEMQQNNVFLPRAPDDAAAVRRQTWFPGLQGPLSESASGAEPEAGSKADSGAGSDNAVPMDTDVDDIDVEQRQQPPAQPSEPDSELDKRNKEMQATLDQIMREYKLLLTTLTQLAEADAIPPSPVRPGSEAQPRELVQIRRKIRALMTTIEVSQKQCRKFRSQRPEAEFLELELQAAQETLADKEEKLVELMRESDEVYARLREAEDAGAVAEQTCQDLRSELDEVEKARAADARAQHDMRAAHDRQSQEMLSEMAAIEEQMVSEKAALDAKADRIQQEADALRLQLEQREIAARTDIEAARATAEQSQLQCQRLESQLASANSRADELAGECKSLTSARDQAGEAARQESERLLAEISRLEKLGTASESAMAEQCSELHRLNEDIGEKTRNAEQAAERARVLLADIDNFKLLLAKAESDNLALVDSHAAQMRDLQEQATRERAQFEQQLAAQQSLSSESQAQLADQLAAQLAAHEDVKSQLNASLDKLRAELEAVSNERTHALTKVEQMESQNADIWERVSELMVTNGDLNTKAAEAEELAAKQTARIDALEHDVAEVTSARDRLQQDIDDMAMHHSTAAAEADAKAGELQAKLDTSAQELNRLRTELLESRGSYDTTAGEAAQLASQVAELSSELDNTKAQLGQSQTALDTLRTDHAGLQQSREQLEQRMADCTQQLEKAISRESQACDKVQQLEGSLEAARAQLQGLQRDMSETDQSNSAVAALNGQLTQDLEAKSLAIAELETRVVALSDSLQNAQSEIECLQIKHIGEAEGWEVERTASKTQIDELRATVVQHEANTFQLNARISNELQPQIDALEAVLHAARNASADNTLEHEVQADSLRGEVGELQRQMEEQRVRMQESEQAADEARQVLQRQLADLHCAHKETGGELDAALRAKQALEERLAALNDELEQKLQDSQVRLDAAVCERQRLEDALSELSTKHSSAAAEGSALSTLTDSLRAELSVKAAELRDVQAELATQHCQAEATVAEATEARAAVEDKAARLRQELDESRTAYSELEAQTDAAIQARDDAQRRLAEAQHALESAQDAERQSAEHATALSAEAAQLAQEIQSLEAARGALQDSYDALAERARGAQEELEQALAAANSELSSKSIALSDLEAALDRANAAADAARTEASSQGSVEVERLESTVASLESQLAESAESVDALVLERDRAHASIDTLKGMMTELAQVKNDEIAEVEQRLEQHQALLETSVGEGLQKDDTIQQLEAAKLRLSEQAATAEAARDEALAQGVREAGAIRAELDSARAAVDRLQADIAQRDSEAAAAGDLSHLEQETARLRALNDKLEKKNAKLRDVYKADISELHAEEEKQRLRAEALTAELAASSQKSQALAVELEKARQDLAAQAEKARAAAAAAKPKSPAPVARSSTPAARPTTPDAADANRTRSAATRLASQLTPIKTEHKRLHAARSPAAMLSPVPPSRLNARVLGDAEGAGCPPRKRTVVDLKSDTAGVKEAPRARSSYGDRRRIRRNQPAERAVGGLEEQTNEQCVQQ